MTCDVTCPVTLLERKKYEEAMSDEHPPTAASLVHDQLVNLEKMGPNIIRHVYQGV